MVFGEPSYFPELEIIFLLMPDDKTPKSTTACIMI